MMGVYIQRWEQIKDCYGFTGPVHSYRAHNGWVRNRIVVDGYEFAVFNTTDRNPNVIRWMRNTQ